MYLDWNLVQVAGWLAEIMGYCTTIIRSLYNDVIKIGDLFLQLACLWFIRSFQSKNIFWLLVWRICIFRILDLIIMIPNCKLGESFWYLTSYRGRVFGTLFPTGGKLLGLYQFPTGGESFFSSSHYAFSWEGHYTCFLTALLKYSSLLLFFFGHFYICTY